MKTTGKRYSAGLQSQGCAGSDPRGPDAGGAGDQTRHPLHDDRGVEAAGDRRDGIDLCWRLGGGAGERRGGDRQAALRDRPTGRGTGFFSQSLRSMSADRRRGMIEMVHADLSILAQCRLLSISRSSFYYTQQPESEETLALMRVIDAAFRDMPWHGSRQTVRHLRRQGVNIGRRRVRRLMTKMGMSPIYQRPRTNDPLLQPRICPYLLRHLVVECQ
jgi:hypothetical protein